MDHGTLIEDEVTKHPFDEYEVVELTSREPKVLERTFQSRMRAQFERDDLDRHVGQHGVCQQTLNLTRHHLAATDRPPQRRFVNDDVNVEIA